MVTVKARRSKGQRSPGWLANQHTYGTVPSLFLTAPHLTLLSTPAVFFSNI